MVNVAILPLAIIGLVVFLTKGREIWTHRGDRSAHWKRERIRFSVLMLSFAGLALVFLAQLLHGVLWIGELGIGIVFLSWGGYLVLSIAFGFYEGFRGE